jgi:hypothetical protein
VEVEVAVYVLLAAASLAFVVGPAVVAARKGYSFWGFLVLGLVAWPIALVVALVLRSRSELVSVGSIVKVRDDVHLNDGGRIPRGHRSKVEDVDVIDGHAVVQITHTDGTTRWIAKSSTVPA